MIRQTGVEQGAASERFTRLQTLFSDALKLPPQDRRPFVEEACADDGALLADIIGMLDADGSPSLLDQNLPTIAHRIFGAESSFATPRVGSYRVIRTLGEGGMGIVYLAERDDVGSLVAVKLLRDAGLSPARRERFLIEQRLLAPLIHPSIARFYDAGTLDDGAPWFAMEYVEGIPVTDYCQQHQCTLEQRLRLFREICSAVQYAHEHAVIHRDLKPSNILVKADGAVRLLDFGIAKQLSELGASLEQTQTLRLLTPAYAAPEQIRGGMVGVFTDIYALGVTLYELVAERLPFDFSNRSPGEIERIITEVEPEKPSVAATLTGCSLATRTEWADLDVLCLTALQKEPQRRYRSAEAFSRDVGRFLENDPLEARPESAIYRLRKFVRRNSRPLLAATAILAIGIALVTFFLIRLTRSRSEALVQAARSERIKQFMQHLFDGDGQAGPSIELRATDVLDRGGLEAQRLDGEPAIQSELFEILGQSYDKLGKYDRAESLLRSALSVRRAAFGDDSKEVAESLVSLGSVRSEQGKYDEALELVRKGSAIQARLLPLNDVALGSSQMTLGRVLTSSGDYKDAIEVLKPAIQSLSRPNAPASDLFLAFDALGTAYVENGQFALAQSTFEQALALAKRIYSPSNPLIAEEMVNLGSVQYSLQNFPLAEKYYRSGLAATRAWYGPDHVLVASESRLLGQTLAKEGRPREGEIFLKQALAIHEHAFGNLHGDAIQDLNSLGFAAQKEGHYKEAEAYFTRVLRIEDTLPHKDALAPMAMHNLAGLKREQKQYGQAEELDRRAVKMAEQMLPPTHLYTGAILLGLGKTLFEEKRFHEAEPYLVNAYEVLSKQGNPSMATLREARNVLAADYRALGKSAEARSLEH